MQTPLTQTFPCLSSLERQDLDSLLNQSNQKDQAFFDAVFHSLPQVKAMYAQHAKLLSLNEDKAKTNVELQKPLEALRSETQYIFDRAMAVQAEWPQLQAEMNEQYKRFSPSSLLFQLTQSANKLNDQSEEMANAYVEGLPSTLDDVTFVRHYKAQRMQYHRRKLIAERWARGRIHWSEQ